MDGDQWIEVAPTACMTASRPGEFALFDSLRQAVCVTDGDLDEPGPRMEYVNQAYLDLFCCEPSDVIGRSPRRWQGPLTDRSVLARLRHHLEDATSVRAQAINYRFDGSAFRLRWTVDPLTMEDGSRKFIAMLDDVTAEQRLRGRLRALDIATSAGARIDGDGVNERTTAVATALVDACDALLADVGTASVELFGTTTVGARHEEFADGIEVSSIAVGSHGSIQVTAHRDAGDLVDQDGVASIAAYCNWLLTSSSG